MTRLIDISPRVSPDLAVWPGDVAYSRKVSLDLERGDNLTLSAIRTTVHLGAHTDAPNHYMKGGGDIAGRDLELYYGLCQVISADVEPGARIEPQDIPVVIKAPRVLLSTGSYPDPTTFNGDFNSLSPALVDHLAECEVRLIGIDTPSVDPFSDKELLSHNAIARHDMAILEGIVLSHVEPGLYTLIALPLPLAEADASPVRAVLIPI